MEIKNKAVDPFIKKAYSRGDSKKGKLKFNKLLNTIANSKWDICTMLGSFVPLNV